MAALKQKCIVNWMKVWRQFNAWCEKKREQVCTTCGYKKIDFPDWEEQERKIASLVEANLRENYEFDA